MIPPISDKSVYAPGTTVEKANQIFLVLYIAEVANEKNVF